MITGFVRIARIGIGSGVLAFVVMDETLDEEAVRGRSSVDLDFFHRSDTATEVAFV